MGGVRTSGLQPDDWTRNGRGESGGRFLKALAALNGMTAVVLFAGLTIVVALQVLTRFLLHVPFIWSEELARFLFFWVVLLGSSLSVRQRRHFVIDVGLGRKGRIRGWGKFLLDLIPDLCVLGFSLLLLVQGAGYVEVGLLRVAPNSQVNMAWVYAAIPVFAALSLTYAAGNLLADLGAIRRGRGPAEMDSGGQDWNRGGPSGQVGPGREGRPEPTDSGGS